jgi:anti-sigma B factor antagonist
MDGMETEVYPGKDLTIVKPRREIRVRSVVALRAVFEEQEKLGASKIAVDLSDVSYIDSSGIGLLLNFSKRLRAGGRMLYLFSPNDDIKAILYIAEIDEAVPFFDCYDDLCDALANKRA